MGEEIKKQGGWEKERKTHSVGRFVVVQQRPVSNKLQRARVAVAPPEPQRTVAMPRRDSRGVVPCPRQALIAQGSWMRTTTIQIVDDVEPQPSSTPIGKLHLKIKQRVERTFALSDQTQMSRVVGKHSSETPQDRHLVCHGVPHNRPGVLWDVPTKSIILIQTRGIKLLLDNTLTLQNSALSRMNLSQSLAS